MRKTHTLLLRHQLLEETWFHCFFQMKAKFLSFIKYGDADYNERKTDWISTPSSFTNIVEAISKSRLKDSLQHADIGGNNILDKAEVEDMFNELEMSHVSVIKAYSLPIEII